MINNYKAVYAGFGTKHLNTDDKENADNLLYFSILIKKNI